MICPRCARSISDDAKFCTFCGQSMKPAPSQPAEPAPAEVAPAPEPQPAPVTTLPEEEPKTPNEPTPAVMDFQMLGAKLQQAGLVVRTYSCEKCGSLIFLPPQGKSLHCMGCQNEISAQQVNDRVAKVFGQS